MFYHGTNFQSTVWQSKATLQGAGQQSFIHVFCSGKLLVVLNYKTGALVVGYYLEIFSNCVLQVK